MATHRLRTFFLTCAPMAALAVVTQLHAAAESAQQKLVIEEAPPAVFAKPNPENIQDLQAMQAHIKLVVNKVMPAIVNAKSKAQGSGVVISEDGLVLTAGHVSGTPGTVFTLTFPDGKAVKGKALGRNVGTDSGLIQITETGKYPFCEMGNSEALKKSDWVLAIAHGGGLRPGRPIPPVRLGRINGTPGKAEKDKVAWVTTEATLVGGDSGGPLFDLQGRVIGIHSRIGQSLTQNMHVPSDTFRFEWDRLVKGEEWGKGAGKGGKGQPPKTEPLTIKGLELMTDERDVKVVKVEAGSAAEKAGFKVNDVISTVNGITVNTVEQWQKEIAKGKAGDELNFEVRRAGQTIKVKAAVEKAAK